ncbi:mobile mystery protein A [Hyphomonas atlantica]|nr:mobile mystery protein A [Hyphomonas atlantica]
MSVKDIARKQMLSRINETAAAPVGQLHTPKEGWISFVRKALGMSGAQLGKRLSLSRGRISQAEKSEIEGGVTLRSMHEMAEGLGCRFVYAIIPESGDLKDVIEAQARKRATALVKRAATHMALEKQSLRDEQNKAEIERLTRELIQNPPSNFWEAE